MICKDCNINKDISEFRLKGKYYRRYCKECERSKSRKYYYDNWDKLQEQSKRYYTANKEKISERTKNHKPSEEQKQRNWELHIKRKYGLSIEDYNLLVEKSGGNCAICGLYFSENINGKLHIDHIHGTQIIRGMLCQSCNTGLGKFKDDVNLLQRAIEYLKPC